MPRRLRRPSGGDRSPGGRGEKKGGGEGGLLSPPESYHAPLTGPAANDISVFEASAVNSVAPCTMFGFSITNMEQL